MHVLGGPEPTPPKHHPLPCPAMRLLPQQSGALRAAQARACSSRAGCCSGTACTAAWQRTPTRTGSRNWSPPPHSSEISTGRFLFNGWVSGWLGVGEGCWGCGGASTLMQMGSPFHTVLNPFCKPSRAPPALVAFIPAYCSCPAGLAWLEWRVWRRNAHSRRGARLGSQELLALAEQPG
jgi:hypothetical protein